MRRKINKNFLNGLWNSYKKTKTVILVCIFSGPIFKESGVGINLRAYIHTCIYAKQKGLGNKHCYRA